MNKHRATYEEFIVWAEKHGWFCLYEEPVPEGRSYTRWLSPSGSVIQVNERADKQITAGTVCLYDE